MECFNFIADLLSCCILYRMDQTRVVVVQLVLVNGTQLHGCNESSELVLCFNHVSVYACF